MRALLFRTKLFGGETEAIMRITGPGAREVKNMIKERVENEMALILHVVPLNQDTDTISTWRIVGDADGEQNRTISILGAYNYGTRRSSLVLPI